MAEWLNHANSKGELTSRSSEEAEIDSQLRESWLNIIPELGPRAWQWDQLVLLKRQVLSRVLHFDNIYRQILDVPGEVLELGVQWGAGLTTLINLRGIYEPFNHARRIIGFDTFAGFLELDVKDTVNPNSKDSYRPNKGSYSTSNGYEETLDFFLSLHERNAPISHKKKFELVKGDVSLTLPAWLNRNPNTICSLVIFDLDVYKPTFDALEAIKPRLTKGSILVFDELGSPNFPGETLALMESVGLPNLRLRNTPNQPYVSWARIGD